MRTFHIGGAAQKGSESFNIESKFDGTAKYQNLKFSTDSKGSLINLSRNSTISILDENNKEIAKHRLPFGCKLNFKDNSKVKSADLLAEWDPFTLPIIAKLMVLLFSKILKKVLQQDKLLMIQLAFK